MSQIFAENGNVIPVTLVLCEPLTVIRVKNEETDGYRAVQFGFGSRKIKNIKKPQRNLGGYRHIKEYRLNNDSDVALNLGDKIDVSIFKEGDKIEVRGVTKSKGFQGVVKRHGFHGGPRTHGQKHSEREAGSIGSTWPQRVIKGMRMAGRMGGKTIKVKNLKIVKVVPEKNELWISGALPGHRGTLLAIKD